MDETKQDSYFAIVGVGRSGTSLLMSMLDAHPLLSLPPETHFIERYVIARPFRESAKLIDDLVKDRRIQRLNLNRDDLSRIVSRSGEKSSPGAFYKGMLRFYAERKGVRIMGDKAPKNIEYLPVLKQLFPTGKIIHIIRDPRDVYLSRTKAAWSSSRSDLSHLVAYRSQYILGSRAGRELFGENYHEIKYENLITNPEIELNKICGFLGIEYDKGMLDFSKSSRDLVSEEEMAWKMETFQPLMSNNMEKWKVSLSKHKIGLIEAVCSRPFRDGYYKTSQDIDPFYFLLSKIYYGSVSVFYQWWVQIKNGYALFAIRKIND